MTNKTITLSITDDEALLNSTIDSIAKVLGWTEDSEETQLELIRKNIMLYLGDIAKAYNANKAAEEARLNALNTTTSAINNITSTLIINE